MKRVCLTVVLVLLCVTACMAQTLQEVDSYFSDYDLPRARTALTLMMQQQPNNHEVVKRWGFLLLLEAKATPNLETAKSLTEQAHAALLKAQKLGSQDELLLSVLAGLQKGARAEFTKNADAQQAMDQAETAFAQKRFDDAITLYESAAGLDPSIYEAPLYTGDAWLQKRDLSQAIQAYQRAISINPDIETAYRYQGDALLSFNDLSGALTCYALAVVAEPDSQFAWKRGLIRGAEAIGATVEIPAVVAKAVLSEEDPTKIVVSETAADAAAPWLAYAMTRLQWRKATFPERYPGQPYRHSLAEEAESLAAVAEVAKELAGNGELQLDPDLQLLVDLKKDGLLESFVLFSRTNSGIGQDYVAYRKNHRAEMARFLTDYVVHEGKSNV